MMNRQDTVQKDNPPSLSEDLAVNQDREEEVKGGTGYSNPPWGLDRIDQR
jgi:hypothetical protein